MKVMTILGTRPEIIRLSLTINKLDKYCDHILVHTGQNFTDSLSTVFFRDLGLREPNYRLGVESQSFAEQIGLIFSKIGPILRTEKPDAILILGDTNSGLVSIIARRMNISVFHMEAGNRCFDYRVPEEINRRVIDHSSTILLPYTHRSKENLLNEGLPIDKIFVIGNPIYEVIEYYSKKIEHSRILDKLGLEKGGYFLVTMHRAENVDDENRLKNLLQSLDNLEKKYQMPIICSLHPRTKNRMTQFGLKECDQNIRFIEPFGFFNFITLEKNAYCVITDSGTVQEECCIFKVPNTTIRDVTERPETLESGSNILASVTPDTVLRAVEIALDENTNWEPPLEYLTRNVSAKVIKIILGYFKT
ncbi:MAG: UDP-N-acetylglucosamine 2-epimerase (non-hydrolyzing) [Dehalococcoidales bacterium]|nr:UDP-N-acetylglucosamine 2-epimerase (non-hydrolyzing) [Dehalococcoidales bacterium]